MKSLSVHLLEWKQDWEKHAEEDPTAFLSDMENILDSSFFEEIDLELDEIRDSLEQLRADVESKIKPKFGVEKLHKLIKLVNITVLDGEYYRQGEHPETLFLNASGKIRPPVNTHQPGDTFNVESISGALGGQELDYPAMVELLKKL